MSKAASPIGRILVVDDDPAILEAMQMMLEMEGYEVVTIVNGEDILKHTKDHADLVFLDIWMSGIDGREICKTLKSASETKQLPIVMISASRDVKESAMASGANDFLAKPFQMDELLSMVKKYISSN